MIKFEILSREHIDEICEIEKLCFPYEEWTYGMIESEIDNKISVFIVGVDENEKSVVCYGCVWCIADIGEITNIAVLPKYQGMGLGDKTLTILTKICIENGMREINLEVKQGNVPAIKLYEKHGFKEVGIRPKYYKDGSDACLMTKII